MGWSRVESPLISRRSTKKWSRSSAKAFTSANLYPFLPTQQWLERAWAEDEVLAPIVPLSEYRSGPLDVRMLVLRNHSGVRVLQMQNLRSNCICYTFG